MKKFFVLLLATALISAMLCASFLTPMTASAAGGNIAQGKRITGADPTNGNQFTDKYNASLLDGLASDEFNPDAAPGDWFAYYFNSNPAYPSNAAETDIGAVGEFTIDLGASASVESVRMHMITNDSHKLQGIHPPYNITIEYSADNASWNTFSEATDFSSYNDIDWVEIKGTSAVNAQYIKVSIYYSGYTLMLNEVQVIGEMGGNGTPDARFEVFDLTAKDIATPEDANWYADGVVIAITNDSDEEKTIASGEYALRYLFILVFDKDGVCIELGNNLLSENDEKAAEFPQHDLTIPAGGFAVLFYYNATEGPSNLALYEYYSDLGGAIYSNETGKVSAGKNYTAEIENNTVTIYFAAPESPAEPSASESSSDVHSEGSSEEPSTSSESLSDTTSGSASSHASVETSAQGEEGGSNVGMIVGIIAAVVVVVGIVAVIIVRKKKS